MLFTHLLMVAQEEPIWRSGFTSYSRAAGGSRLRLNSGFWVVLTAAARSIYAR